MLNYLRRKKVARRILIFLAIIIIPAFILWGAESITKRRGLLNYVGVLDGKKITLSDFVKMAEASRVELFLSYFNQPEALDKIAKDRKLINRLAWENLIFNSAAKKSNISVSDRDVADFLTRHPLFTRSGMFDSKLYTYILKNTFGMVPRQFEESVRDALLRSKYKIALLEGVSVSEEELEWSYKNEFEKAKVSYVIIDKESFKNGLKIGNGEIASFYEKNKERFVDPERVVVEYISFPHREENTREKALDDLIAAYKRLKKDPKNAAKIARELNIKWEETLPFAQNEIMPDIAAIKGIEYIAFKIKPLSDIVPIISEEEKGVSYIIRVKEKIPSRIKPIDKVSPYITDVLKDEKAVELAKNEAQRIYENAEGNNLTLNDIAKNNNLGLRTTELISRFDYIEGIGESYKCVDESFKLQIGDISKPLQVRKGFALISPVEFSLIDREKFEKEKADFKNKLLAVRKMKALQDWFKNETKSATLAVDLDRL